MKSSVQLVNRFLGGLCVIVFAILVACVAWQVISRYILGTPSTTTDEIARFLFMWIAFIGAAYTLGQKRHLAIDFVSITMEGASLRAMRLLVIAIIAAFVSIVMVYGGWQLVTKTLATGQVSPALRIPMGYIYGAIPFSGVMMLFYCVALTHDVFEPDPPSDEGDTTPSLPDQI